uniref:ribonuclease 2-like n=1 Tax=Erigeron canadensis TaxID=72917 RepID=UPI001CB8EEF6|nr:ribonuclease 2-like [Erigeron canadensis]
MTSHPIARILELILIAGVFFAVEVAGSGVVSTVAEEREFDYFTLALVWPPTYCTRSTKCCKQSGCCRGENNPSVFTISGLWPDYNDGTYPSCCEGPSFNANEISPLQGVMDTYWPSFSCKMSKTCNNTKVSFWASEWEKHGTCAAPVTGGQYNFFQTAINLYSAYNVSEVIFGAGYVPSNSETYPSSGIISALENAFHATPQIKCKNGALQDLRICFTKDFKFRDCVGESKCPNDVSLPEPDVTRIAGLSVFGHESS